MVPENELTADDIRLLVTMIIHDLEKPMSVTERILGRILDGSLDPRNRTHCRLIRSAYHSSAGLKRMLTDLNDVLDGRMMNAQLSAQRVTDLVDAAAHAFLPLAESEDIRFVWNCDSRAVVDVDSDLTQRILQNFLHNALAHTGSNGIIRMGVDESLAGKMVIRVENTGPIIPESRIDQIFQPGVQLDLRSHRRWRGHGLGLAFCRLAATSQNSRVGAANLPDGDGMVFYLEIDVQRKNRQGLS